MTEDGEGPDPEIPGVLDRSPTYRGKPLEQLMALPRRQAILELVAARPGICLNELSRELRVSNSSVIWHYEVLASLGLLTTQRQGAHRCYFLGPRAKEWLRLRRR
ncbi:MAG TPA: winged helix-turn-helix domain-containing protein [Candidatus Thermoplasmatota archaeon]|nr:winged helix-turn-helix domain-containing protein [Candidatus Thermoplasmatota archaeon]